VSDETELTVSEAAARLACSERTLRRLLARPEYAGRTVTEQRQTKTGTREARLLPADLLRDLGAELARWEQTPADTGRRNDGSQAANTGTTSADAGRLLVAYERLLQEQQARIGDLTAALEHEREQSKRLQDALQREQTLRVIAPQETLADLVDPEPSRAWWQVWKRGKGHG
jgi:hypothetical protein